jgi:hypothetical protein
MKAQTKDAPRVPQSAMSISRRAVRLLSRRILNFGQFPRLAFADGAIFPSSVSEDNQLQFDLGPRL